MANFKYLPCAHVLQAWAMAGEYKPRQVVQGEGAVPQEPQTTGKQPTATGAQENAMCNPTGITRKTVTVAGRHLEIK